MEMKAKDVTEAARAIAVLCDGAIVAAQHGRDPSFARTARVIAEGYVRQIEAR
ncbi:hypothetical protein [Celeribacter sp.]|uniref:hypothetical protein n=1 Tax=Celeribacter sp. TaxID=1890673 RepID=UPI003A94FD42